jgi:hypothetical protein
MESAGLVTVDLDPGQPPPACRAKTVNVLVDEVDDAYPPASKTVRVARPGVKRVRVPLFDQLDSPDTVRAISVSANGTTSATTSVAIAIP